MEKVKENINKIIENHSLVIIIILGLILSSALTVFTVIRTNDKLWNLVNIYKMYNGGTIYVDNNVIITPLFFYIGLLLFKIFGANYLTFNIYNILIWMFFDILVYSLFSILISNKKTVVISTILIIFSACLLIPSGANYNFLAVDLILLGIILNKKYENKKINILLQGVLCFAIFFTKQNIGAMYILSTIALNIFKWKNYKKKEYILVIIKELAIAATLLILSLGTMYLKGNLNGFLNYAVLGIGEFAKGNTSRNINRLGRRNRYCCFCFVASFCY